MKLTVEAETLIQTLSRRRFCKTLRHAQLRICPGTLQGFETLSIRTYRSSMAYAVCQTRQTYGSRHNSKRSSLSVKSWMQWILPAYHTRSSIPEPFRTLRIRPLPFLQEASRKAAHLFAFLSLHTPFTQFAFCRRFGARHAR